MIMKRITLFVVVLLSALQMFAQIPPASPAACAECGAKNGQPHKSWCSYAPHEEPEPEPEQPSAPAAPATPVSPASHSTAPTPSNYHSEEPTRPDFSSLSHPTVQARPLFSGINEHNLTVQPTELTSQTQWGEVDLRSIGSFTYDICRYTNVNHTAVVLGHTQPNGTVEWKVLKKFPYGYYNECEFLDYGQAEVSIVDIHLEAEGRYIIADYSNGTNSVFDSWGNVVFLPDNHQIRLLDFKDGDRYFFEEWDASSSQYAVWAVHHQEKQLIALSKREIQYYDNALVAYDGGYVIYDYDGHYLTLKMEGRDVMFFDDVMGYPDDTKWHFVIEKKEWNTSKYAIVTSDLEQYGGWYSSFGEAQRAWAGR